MVKIILIWSICVILISIILGEIVNQISKKKQGSVAKENKHMNNGFNFEVADFFSMFALRLRGSWRVANGYIMDDSNFQELKKAEYGKKL